MPFLSEREDVIIGAKVILDQGLEDIAQSQ